MQDSVSLSPINAVSVEAWVKPMASTSPLSEYQVIVSKNLAYELTITKSGILRGGIINASNTRATINAKSSVSANVWNHIVMTYDGAFIKIYANGQLKATKAHSGLIKDNDLPLTIGKHGINYHFMGAIDEVLIYNKALSDAEVYNRYISGTVVSKGELYVKKDTSFNGAHYITPTSNVLIGKYELTAAPIENVIISSIQININDYSKTSFLMLKDENTGTQIGHTMFPLHNEVIFNNLNYLIPQGHTLTLGVFSDINAQLIPAVIYTYIPQNGVNAFGNASLETITAPPTTTYGQVITVE
ncbi:MAG: LamG domain-containing protein [bacterium]